MDERDLRQAGPIVLLGGGHAHLEVVRHLGQLGLGRDLAGGVTLVSPSRHAPYSGMLPGHIAGAYGFAEFHVDLLALCRGHGIRFLETAATGIDPERRRVFLQDGSRLDYRLLSIDIGSTPVLPPAVTAGIPVKPIASFAERLLRLDALADQGRPLALTVIGQGVAGVEVAFALKRRYRGRPIEIALAGRAPRPVPERSLRAGRLVERELAKAGIAHHRDFDVVAVEDGEVLAKDGRRLKADEFVWTTSSGAPAWLRETGLLLDPDGFIRVDEKLRSLSHSNVFAAGDVAALVEPRPKAGVFAVREGPVLADNIHRSMTRGRLKAFRPQRAWLALISLSDGRAIADKWQLALLGRWVTRWKERIDSRFLQRYRTM
ncbi:FAD-dependent oxidoreductase [Rhizobium sp. SSA_523]|uniref:FAD-dependent oxidoreductase n=1 Tax=Rhizobium sp. SSA_523 TaxID=2952477 RepID=UPI0020916228|nr:FAD-dependent oxidoreductase [Rhizobium sp. SSA_523]MCO5733120.1 FAD-dependent oxidoreductase [Rhizobium sp. SSA_523]WKC23994.1 FAD-dependent oxidoreductase [Rhizobium sp. SSA_523]